MCVPEGYVKHKLLTYVYIYILSTGHIILSEGNVTGESLKMEI